MSDPGGAEECVSESLTALKEEEVDVTNSNRSSMVQPGPDLLPAVLLVLSSLHVATAAEHEEQRCEAFRQEKFAQRTGAS